MKIQPGGGSISELVLAQATATLNRRIRHAGYSAREILYRRNQESGEDLLIKDQKLSDINYKRRVRDHKSSEQYKSRGHSMAKSCKFVHFFLHYFLNTDDVSYQIMNLIIS